MKKIVLLLILALGSCKNSEKDNQIVIKKNETSNLITKLSDSLFIGEPLISIRSFIEEIQRGRETDKVFLKYQTILEKHNQLFIDSKLDIKELSVNKNLSLELRKKISKDIHIILYTKINNIVKDSTTIFKFKQNNKGETLATIYFLENDLTFWKLETNSIKNKNEIYLGIEHWTKHKIDLVTGKINLQEELNPVSGINNESAEEGIEDDVTTEIIDVEKNRSINTLIGKWNNNCENPIGIEVKEKELVVTVAPNQYYITLAKINQKYKTNVFKYKLKSMEGIGSKDDYSEYYFNDKEIAIITVLDNNKIEFNWLGFYNKKINERQYTDSFISDKNPIIFSKCEFEN